MTQLENNSCQFCRHLSYQANVEFDEQISGTVFIRLHFLLSLHVAPIS
jgi:hypothetical protein